MVGAKGFAHLCPKEHSLLTCSIPIKIYRSVIQTFEMKIGAIVSDREKITLEGGGWIGFG
jgi:hypothetical protein